MTNINIKFAESRINIARELYNGALGAGYAEGMIILNALYSALAAKLWPGDHIDKKRFIEMLVQFSNVNPEVTRISIPLLIGNIISRKMNTEANILKSNFMDYQEDRVITYEDTDKSETEVKSLCSSLRVKDIRNYSYATILYEEIRCNYIHQYCSGEKADSWSMIDDGSAKVSYVNWMEDPNRHIHFHFEWVVSCISSIVSSLNNKNITAPLQIPGRWWIDI